MIVEALKNGKHTVVDGLLQEINITWVIGKYSNLVGGLEHFFHILGIIIPTD